MSPRYDTTDVEPAPEPCATSEMCQFCFDIVISDLSSENNRFANDRVPLFMGALPPTIACPLFITWDKKKVDSSVEYVLRGCIGSLSPRPLATAVRDYALTSALRDNRFDPVRLEEVPNLRVGVSLLVKYEQCTHVYDWQVGIHGILIKFTENGLDYSATYLPEVAKEQQWTQEEAVTSLIRKSGYRGVVLMELLSNIQCTRYQSSKCRLTYEEYVESLNGIDPLAGISVSKRSCVVT